MNGMLELFIWLCVIRDSFYHRRREYRSHMASLFFPLLVATLPFLLMAFGALQALARLETDPLPLCVPLRARPL